MGYEGIFGFLFWITCLAIFQQIPCDLPSLCVNGVIEDTVGVFEDYASNPKLLLISVILIFLAFSINTTGAAITKYGSAA